MATIPSTVVKIGIKLQGDDTKLPLLKEFDLNNTVVSFVNDICEIWKLSKPSEYVLRFPEDIQRNYVTEDNKNAIKHGLLLILDLQPQLAAKKLVSMLQINMDSKSNALNELSHICKYRDFAEEFIKERGMSFIILIIETKHFKSRALACALMSFEKLMDHNIVSWNIMDSQFVGQIVHFLSDEQFYDSPLIISISLSILNNYIINVVEIGDNIQKDVLVSDLIMRIGSSGVNELIMRKTISFINVLFKYSNKNDCKIIGASLLSKNVRNIIWIIISQAENSSTELAKELYLLQTNCLDLIQQRIAKIDNQSQYSRELMRELSRIAVECEETTQSQTSKKASVSSTNKMGFVNDSDPISDLNKDDSTGVLALDCMVYFARNYEKFYLSIILENNCIVEKYQCPFGKSSIELVSLLCDVLKTASSKPRYYPMFFNHAHPFEEFFCICIMLFNKTWKEMKATSEDTTKVFGVVKEQIIQALSKFSLSFEIFRHGLKSMTYAEISDLWQHKRTAIERRKSMTRPVVRLKEEIKPDIMYLIKQHRLGMLVKGKRFPKLTSKGFIVKNKFWFIRLSPNHTFLQYGDCTADSVPTLDELESVVPVSNIKNLTVKNSASAKDKKNNLFSFSIEIVSGGTRANLDFMTENEQVFDYWTDGLNALLQCEMSSKTCTEDFDTLMSMEIRLRLLHIDGINIPTDPPPIPPPPLDYNFSFVL